MLHGMQQLTSDDLICIATIDDCNIFDCLGTALTWNHVPDVGQVMLTVWRQHVLVPLIYTLVFVTIEATFLSSSLLKVPKVRTRRMYLLVNHQS